MEPRSVEVEGGAPEVARAEPKLTGLWLGAIVALVVLAVAVPVSWFVVPINGWPTRGAFGDAWAPWIGLVTAGALLAALWSVRLQRHELGLQREMLQAQLDEMEDSRVALQEQAAAQKMANKLALENALAQVCLAQAQIHNAKVAGLGQILQYRASGAAFSGGPKDAKVAAELLLKVVEKEGVEHLEKLNLTLDRLAPMAEELGIRQPQTAAPGCTASDPSEDGASK